MGPSCWGELCEGRACPAARAASKELIRSSLSSIINRSSSSSEMVDEEEEEETSGAEEIPAPAAKSRTEVLFSGGGGGERPVQACSPVAVAVAISSDASRRLFAAITDAAMMGAKE